MDFEFSVKNNKKNEIRGKHSLKATECHTITFSVSENPYRRSFKLLSTKMWNFVFLPEDLSRRIMSILQEERKNCTFNRLEITNLLDGSAKATENRRELERFILSFPELQDKIPIDYLSHEDRYAEELRKACLLIRKGFEAPGNDGQANTMRYLMGAGVGSAVLKEGNPLAVHFVMFVPTIMNQGTPEQQMEWLSKAWNCEIVGTYAQTELGHGTFLRGLETTATYDPTTEDFVLNTPTVTAYKWWPGGLGKTANHAVVMAQLWTKGKCHGPHPFLVQLRDTDTHEPLSGIDVGEIGPKMGLNTNDNGYLGFKSHRIPRTAMLMKYSQVLPDGTYVKPAHSKLSYGTMVFVRVVIVSDACQQLMKAATIAVRYSCVRKQSELIPGEPEPQIIEYQAQQAKIFPPVAACFALKFAAFYIIDLYQETTQRGEEIDLDLLPELHALSCGLKALSTTDIGQFVEVLRQSCGGHGYMSNSNFPRIYSQVQAAYTYEGENTVLWLQVARHLIKSYKNGGNYTSSYLSEKEIIRSQKLSGNIYDPYFLETVFRRTAFGLVRRAAAELDRLTAQGMNPHIAWNKASVLLIDAAKGHSRYFVVHNFNEKVASIKISQATRDVICHLRDLYLVHGILAYKGDFIMFGGLSDLDIVGLQSRQSYLFEQIRPNAVSIVDAFDIRDEILNSTLGVANGDVYNRLMEEAKNSPLNLTQVHSSFQNYLKPFMNAHL
ncbi:acyl-coenzyme A oxidase 1-like isoform X10 [Artemia franciscana]